MRDICASRPNAGDFLGGSSALLPAELRMRNQTADPARYSRDQFRYVAAKPIGAHGSPNKTEITCSTPPANAQNRYPRRFDDFQFFTDTVVLRRTPGPPDSTTSRKGLGGAASVSAGQKLREMVPAPTANVLTRMNPLTQSLQLLGESVTAYRDPQLCRHDASGAEKARSHTIEAPAVSQR